MNIEMIRSVAYKLTPVVVAFLVGRKVINQELADQIPAVVDWVIVGLTLAPTLWRSWMTYHKSKDDAPPAPPIDLKPA